ncbi:MAG: DNA-binding protein [Deltaproteobacteria bacterium]|nr:MAG: DNA-binding protein [Deltaproteobacteria bacterium]
MEDKLLRPREAARILAVSRSTIYRWFWEGKIRGIKFGGNTVRILQSGVDAYLRQQKPAS